MEKRKVTIFINGRPCTLYSDDSDEYIRALESRADEALMQTAGNAVHAVISLTDQLMRMEQAAPAEQAKQPQDGRLREQPQRAEMPDKPEKPPMAAPKKKPAKTDEGQVSIWELIEHRENESDG